MQQLGEISTLAQQLRENEQALAQAEDLVKTLKGRIMKLTEEDLPYAMKSLGLSELKLETGEKLTIKDEVYASISAGNKDAALLWLDDNGFGGLIKTNVGVQFSKGEDEKARNFVENLIVDGYDASYDRGVHPQTLKAFLKEQLAAGKAVPLDLFGARPISKAVLK